MLAGWDIQDGASTYILNVREGIFWNNGDRFDARDVARNIERWCDRSVANNSMANRFSVLVDPDTELAITNSIEVVGEYTVRLNLPRPDITLIASMSDYPAAIVPASFDACRALEMPIGTGPYVPTKFELGKRATLGINEQHEWWDRGNGAWVAEIEFVDGGDEPSTWLAAAQSDEIDMTYTVLGSNVGKFRSLEGWKQNDIVTSSTVVVRVNQLFEENGRRIYSDRRVRRALQMAVDNRRCLEMGLAGQGSVAHNHHFGPMYPDFNYMDREEYNPDKAKDILREAGLLDYEHQLVSLADDGYREETADSVAQQLCEAGIKVKRVNLPGEVYWKNWLNFGFSCSNWNHRPLGIQTLALAYRSNSPWNETAFSSKEFDENLDLALSMTDHNDRRVVIEKLQRILLEEAVVIQPYWRTLTNFTKRDLYGGEHHLSSDIRPHRLQWKHEE